MLNIFDYYNRMHVKHFMLLILYGTLKKHLCSLEPQNFNLAFKKKKKMKIMHWCYVIVVLD